MRPQGETDWRDRILAPPAWKIVAAAALFAVDEWVYQGVGTSIVRQAPLDWTDHLLTTLFIVWAVRPWWPREWLVPALFASVLIDLDHVPQHLGSGILTGGTSRPYTHSLTTIVVLLLLSLPQRRWRSVAIGCAIGVASHLWRDLAEPQGAGVALFWPVTDRTITTPAVSYLGSIGGLALIGIVRTRARRPGSPVSGDG